MADDWIDEQLAGLATVARSSLETGSMTMTMTFADGEHATLDTVAKVMRAWDGLLGAIEREMTKKRRRIEWRIKTFQMVEEADRQLLQITIEGRNKRRAGPADSEGEGR